MTKTSCMEKGKGRRGTHAKERLLSFFSLGQKKDGSKRIETRKEERKEGKALRKAALLSLFPPFHS